MVRIHLSYSDRHFNPDRSNAETEWYSCAQIARHMWSVLENNYKEVTYGDEIPNEHLDLLWTNRLCKRKKNVARMATFASVAHYALVAQQVWEARRWASHLKPEGSYSLKDRWRHWLTLSNSDLVLAIGNETIRRSFFSQLAIRSNYIIDCGVDTNHFLPPFDNNRKPIFIHNATRFSVRKGSHLVANAWRKVSVRLPAAQLILLGRDGDVDMRELLQGLSNVIYGGEYKSGSTEYIKRLGISRWVVLPSLAEGQAGTLLEAMSCGCVPIASKTTGVDAEIYGGYPLEHNTADQLTNAMLRAARDWSPEQSSKVRSQTVKFHDWNIFDQNILHFTKQLLAKSPQKAPLRITTVVQFLLHLIFDVSQRNRMLAD